MSKIFLIIVSLFLFGCANNFPTEYLVYIDQKKQVCEYYKINQDKVKFTFDKQIPYKDCPIVYGFPQEKVSEVMNWIRTM